MGDSNTTPWRTAALGVVVIVAVAGALAVGPMSAVSQDDGPPTPGEDGDINCDEFDTREEVGEVFDPNDDEFGLDGNDNGIACEDIGANPTTEGPGGAVTTDELTPTATSTTTETETETETATETAEAEATEMEQPTASVTFDNQSSDGVTVVVESVTMSEGGFIAIHNASLLDGNTLGSVVGVSEPLSAGTHENVEVTLFDVPGQGFSADMTLEESQTLIAMPHFDSNANGVYDFITSNASEDGPYTEDGSAVVDPASVTVSDGMDTQADGNGKAKSGNGKAKSGTGNESE